MFGLRRSFGRFASSYLTPRKCPPSTKTQLITRLQCTSVATVLSPEEVKDRVEQQVMKQQQQQQQSPQTDALYKKLELEVLAYEPSVLDSYQWFVLTSASHLGITVGKCWAPLKSDKYRFPLLKSAFVHKKHQVHYEIRTYHRFLTFHKLTESTASTFLEYIERNLPEGIGLKVTRVQAQPLPNFISHQQQSS